jgi:hypothetical protein
MLLGYASGGGAASAASNRMAKWAGWMPRWPVRWRSW